MATNWTEEIVSCKKCARQITALDVFPGGICLQCHAEKVDKLPLEKPDFIGAITVIRRKR